VLRFAPALNLRAMATQIDPGYPDKMLLRAGSFVTFKCPDRSLTFSQAALGQPDAGGRAFGHNPWLEVRRGIWEVRDVQNVADVLVDSEVRSSDAIIGKRPATPSWSAPFSTFSMPSRTWRSQCRELSLRSAAADQHDVEPHDDDAAPGLVRAHPVIASATRELLNKSDNERSGVLSTAMSFLGLYRDPVVAQVTSRCDWRIRDLVEDSQPATLYLVVPPSDISRASRWSGRSSTRWATA
jgi:type IV secretion system protein VirD4